jgi:hypothetical protein
MENNKHIFKTELTDGRIFRKYQKISWLIVILFFVMSLGFSIFSGEYPEDTIDSIQIPFAIFAYSLLAISAAFYFYSIKKRVCGILKIFVDKIEIQNNESNAYTFDQLTNFEIQRGSTYHYTHQIDNVLIKVNNFVRFTVNKEAHEYEFYIDSKDKNKAFESMIDSLQKNRVKLHYTSI